MRSKLKHQFFVYMLILTVIFTVGLDFYSDTPAHSYEINNSNQQKVDLNNPPLIKLITKNFIPIHSYTGKAQDPVRITEKQASTRITNIVTTEDEVKATNYEVISYYLNVRENTNVTSKILNVVKNGDILEVLAITENDWLKLKSGGYVNGKYTKLTREQVIIRSHPAVNKMINAAVPSKPTTTVKSDSKLTEEHIAQIFEGTSLADHGLEETIVEIEQEYGINAYFTIAVMKLESGHGNSKIAKNKNNLFGLNAIDGDAYNKAYSFKTKAESVQKFGQLISENYIDKGYTDVEKVAKKYCNANPKWSVLVMSIMNSDYKKLL